MNSRSKALVWPYPRHQAFEETLRRAAAEWFAARGYPVHQKMPYLLASWEDWQNNIILPEVATWVAPE